MLHVVWSGLRRRAGRSVAVLLAIGVATTTFTVLTGASDTQRLVTTGTVSKSFRSAYDVLVRPAGVMDPLERADGTVRPDFLAGVHGGITTEQYRRIADLAGVEVAAPIAVVGSMSSKVYVPIPLQQFGSGGPTSLFTVDTTWTTDRGLSTITPGRQVVGRSVGGSCPDSPPLTGPFEVEDPVFCTGPQDDKFYQALGFGKGQWGTLQTWRFPFILAAIDPQAEARLTGLDGAVVTGKYLGGELPGGANVPVLAAATTPTDLSATSTIGRVGASENPLTQNQVRAAAAGPAGAVVETSTVTAETAYERLLSQLSTSDTDNLVSAVDIFWNPSAAQFENGKDSTLHPLAQTNPLDVWRSRWYGDGWARATPGSDDVSFRTLSPHPLIASSGDAGYDPVVLRAVGTFDPSKLPASNPLSRISLGTFFDPTLAAADEASRATLKDQSLAPSGSMTSYLQAPPLLLTSLDALPTILGSGRYADTQTQASAPISAIRVRVSGVTGPDPVSRERIRQVAQAIASTGLTVDITAGSSPTPRTVALPAGNYGRPALTLTEDWVKKGVAVSILTAIDRKSVALFGLILAVCCLVVANTTNASVRARRSELAILSCVGWPARRLFALVLAESSALGLTAGILGSAAAIPLARALGLSFSPTRALLAIPAATLLAILAGLPPALTAARAHPAHVVNPPVADVRRAHHPRTVTQVAALNVLRTPGRSVLAAAALAVGTAALTLLLGLTLAFRGVLVGSVLGDALAVQTRGVDYIAVAAMLILGALGVADVLYLDIRENAAELATLRATGWADATISRLLTTQGAILGVAGGLIGAAAGLAGTVTLAGTVPPTLVAAAALAALGAILLSGAAAALIASSIRRLPTASLLAGE